MARCDSEGVSLENLFGPRGSQAMSAPEFQVKCHIDEETNELGDRKRAQALLSAQRRSLQLVARGASLTDVLQDLCDTIDAQSPEIISAVFLVDTNGKELRPAAGHRLPDEWIHTISPLPIGPRIGACGTAAFLKKPVIASDIANDP